MMMIIKASYYFQVKKKSLKIFTTKRLDKIEELSKKIDCNNLKYTVISSGEDADANNTNKKVIFKNCVPITNCISEINNKQVDNAKDLDIVIPMYNLMKYSDSYSKISESLWQYFKDIPAVDNNYAIVNFTDNNLTDNRSNRRWCNKKY